MTEGIGSHQVSIIGTMTRAEVVILSANSLLPETAATGNLAGSPIMSRHVIAQIAGHEVIGDRDPAV